MIILLFAAGTAIISAARLRNVSVAAMETDPPVFVIDAGHGGLDGGAVSVTGEKESVINLAIAQKLYDLCRLMGQSCAMTRTEETLEYPPEADSIRAKKLWDQERRIALVNDTPKAVLISIHQNLYPDARPNGTQVLYADSEGSEDLAKLTHDNLRLALCSGNRRVAVPAADNIYLMKHAQCPAIIVECGFLSNPEEAKKLLSPDYQTMIATVLCASCLQFITPVI